MQGVLSEPEMNELLSSEVFGHLGCTDGKKPYVVPMAYVFHENMLYGQTTEGKKIEMLRKNPLLCFQVERFRDGQWRSVVCWGTFEELDFEDLQDPDAIAMVKLLTKRIAGIQGHVGVDIPYDFSGKAVPLRVNEKTSTLFRIALTEKTGRFYQP